MPSTEDANDSGKGSAEPIPIMQRIMDDPFLLLFIGVAMPTIFYLLWGVMEVASIPLAP